MMQQEARRPSIARAVSGSVPYGEYSQTKRNHSCSVCSVESTESVNSGVVNALVEDDKEDSRATKTVGKKGKGKVRLPEDVDLEKQLILTAGGKREYVCGFLCKLMILILVVIACGVLIFFAL